MPQIKQIHRFVGHSGAIYSLSSGLAAGTILSGSSDKFVAQWNLQTLNPEKFALRLSSPVYAIKLLADEKILLIGTSSGMVHIIDLEKKEEIKVIQVFSVGIFDIKTTNGKFFVASSDGHLAIGNLADYSITRIIKISNSKIRQLDAYQNFLAVASGDGFIRVFDVGDFSLIHSWFAHNLSANAVKFLPNGNLLSGGRDAYLKLWNADNNFGLEKAIPAHNFAIYSIAIQPLGQMIATASRDKTVKIWNNDLTVLARLDKVKMDGHLNSVNVICWDAFTGYLISAGDDRSIIVWDISN